jgi:hypothetical protein
MESAIELRWQKDEWNPWTGLQKVLQYRTKYTVMDYGIQTPNTNDYGLKTVWSEWKTVPTIQDESELIDKTIKR